MQHPASAGPIEQPHAQDAAPLTPLPAAERQTAAPATPALRAEHGGQPGPDPTRYGDWEKNGRCIDF